jgi:hypothetical protein
VDGDSRFGLMSVQKDILKTFNVSVGSLKHPEMDQLHDFHYLHTTQWMNTIAKDLFDVSDLDKLHRTTHRL